MKVTYTTKDKPLINAGYHYAARVSYRVNGKTRRKYCNTKKEANEFAERLRSDQDRFGSLAKTLSEKELSDAARIMDICKVNNWNPFEVLDFYGAHTKKNTVGNKFADVVETVCKRKTARGGSAKYIAQFHTTVKDFALYINGAAIDTVNTKTIRDYIESPEKNWSDRTKNYQKALLGGFFNTAVELELAATNPCKAIKKYDVAQRDIGFLNPDGVENVMDLIQRIDPQMAVIYTLVFFCGLRLAEAARMSWDWISLEQGKLKVPAQIAKTCKRVIDIPDNAMEWLAMLKKEVPTIELYERNKELADMTKPQLQLWKDAGATELGNRQKVVIRKCRLNGVAYSKNAVRHAYGTFHLALYNNIAKTAHNMGNSPNMITNHYNGECMDKAAPAKFFSIRPK